MSPDVVLNHYSFGVVIANAVSIGRRVHIMHNAAMSVTERSGSRGRIIIEDGGVVGTNAVITAPSGQTLRIGRWARIDAGAVVTTDVPVGATAVGPAARILVGEQAEEAVIEDAGRGPHLQERP